MKEMDHDFVDDGDPKKGPQAISTGNDIGEGLLDWDGCFNEENNSEKGCGSIYGHSDDVEVTLRLDVSIDHIMDNGVPVKKRRSLRKNLRRLWEEQKETVYFVFFV